MNEPKYYCSYQQSVKLKELGFDEHCDYFFDNVRGKEDLHQAWGYHINTKSDANISCPTRAQALCFFREKFQLFGWVQPYANSTTNFSFNVMTQTGSIRSEVGFITPELAETELINRLIAIAEKRKND